MKNKILISDKMNIPKFIVIYASILLTIRELRNWTELYYSYIKNEDEKENEMPDCVKHLYS
jgi:hypothetical protein